MCLRVCACVCVLACVACVTCVCTCNCQVLRSDNYAERGVAHFFYCAPSQIAAYPKNADDVEVQEQLMAGVFPFFRATVAKTCPVALREDLAIHFPELLSDEFKDLMGLGALS